MKYSERQKFNQPWIWIGLLFSGIVTIGLFGLGFYIQIIQGKKFGNNPISDNGLTISLILVILLFLLIFLLFGFANLTTVIDKSGIAYKFFPFHLKYRMINWDAIGNCEVISYKPIRDYGGWGVRYAKKGKAYNVSGDKGLQLQLKSGKRILIGTQNDAVLSGFLDKLNKTQQARNF